MAKKNTKQPQNFEPPTAPADHPALEPQEKLLARARKYEILSFVCEHSGAGKSVQFDAIHRQCCSTLGEFGKPTMKGYLHELQRLGLIENPDHGKYRLSHSLNDLFDLTLYGDRRRRNTIAKEAVARQCVNHKRTDGRPLLGNRFCLISHGTSTEPLFRFLRDASSEKRPERVITNSIPGLIELIDFPLVDLSIIGGKPDLACGGLRPHGKEAVSAWLGNVEFNTAILSCTSVDPSGHIWCGDGMENFRGAVLDMKNIEIIMLADSSKLGSLNRGGELVNNTEWNKDRTWLFVDDNKTAQNSSFFDEFEKLLGEHFVKVTPEVDAA